MPQKPIFIALSPNAERDDIFLALKILFSPWKWNNGHALKLFQVAIQKYFDVKHVFLLSSGRASLYAILRALNLKNDDEVLLQAYTCVAVPDSILWAGAKPIYVDIMEESGNMDPADLKKKITPESKVLIIQHTFGLPAKLDELLAIAREHKLFVIEDCAHALGAKYNGKLVGTFGDASFLSFGRDKVISSVFGGAILTKNDELRKKIEKEMEFYHFPTYAWIWQQLLHPVLLSLVKMTYSFFGIGKFLQKVFRKFHVLSLAVTRKEKQGQMPDAMIKKMPEVLAVLALHQFKKLDRMNEHRKKIARMYEKHLGRAGVNTTIANHIFLRYTIQAPYPREIFVKAKEQNIFLGDWYQEVIAPKGVNFAAVGYTIGSCPVAEALARVSLNLPTHIGVNENDAERIIFLLKQFLR